MDRQKDGWKDGQTDKPYFIGAFWLRPWVQKVKDNMETLTKNTLCVRVSILVKQKLFSFGNDEKNIT